SLSLKNEFDPTGLVQRCVIIQRDENGFGLTVSGDNPVFVQLVKEGKTLSLSFSLKHTHTHTHTHTHAHTRTSLTLSSGSYVALTVLGRPPGLPQIPLEEEKEGQEENGDISTPSTLSAPHSPALSGGEQCSPLTSSTPCNPQENTTSSSLSDGVRKRRTPSYCVSSVTPLSDSLGSRETPCQSPDISHRDGLSTCPSPDADDAADTVRCTHRFLFSLLCYLYGDMYKQTSSKESRRFFIEFHSLFMDRTANLKVPVPEPVSAELEKRRLELIPEDLCKQYTQALQDMLLPDLHKNLEDFRQKRSMGLTLAEDELCKLDSEPGRDQQAVEKECSCAEHILSKIEDILLTSQSSEEEKCQTMQYVILTYMKHLGVKVKEPRGLEHKRARINFLPRIKVQPLPHTRCCVFLCMPDNVMLVVSRAVGKAVELNKQRPPKLPQPPFGISELSDLSASSSGQIRANHLSEGSDTSTQFLPSTTTTPTHSSPTTQVSDTSGQESDSTNIKLQFLKTFLFTVCILKQSHYSWAVSAFLLLKEITAFILHFYNCLFPFVSTGRIEVQCDIQSEDDQGGEAECEEDPLNWQRLVSRGVLTSLTPQEIKRQEVINELFYTERAHLRMLKVLDCVFCQRLSRDGILPPEDIKHIFINLEEIIQLHVSITEQMTAIRKRSETSVIGQIGDDLLGWFSGEEEEKLKSAVATFCSNQPSALELIKTRQKKDQRFNLFMQEAQSNRLCRRLQLKDIIPVEMQRVTKYPLLLDNIAKYTEDSEERKKVKKAGDCCKKILNHVNQAVKEAENKQRLEEYQRRLDFSSLKQSENPVILELKNLDLTKRKMVHEGPLSWKVNKEKTIELYTLLLEDIMVLLQKQDERLVLKFHGKNLASVVDTKHTFSPIIKLNTVLVRPVATDNKSFFVLSMSENGAQIYELTAQTVSDQRTWQRLITQCADTMKAKLHNISIPDKEAASTPDIQDPPESLNPFDGLRSEDEEEELPVVDRQEEEGNGEVDEAELEAFLDGQLAERLLQEGSRLGIALENEEEHNVFVTPSSKAEEALRTCKSCKCSFCLSLALSTVDSFGTEIFVLLLSSPKYIYTTISPDLHLHPGGFMVLDFPGSEESSTDDDAGVGSDVGIDMRKLLSSSSQMGGGGPNLSRQLMTHLRLLQADLQYLKDIEMKYNELQQVHGDAATDSDDNNGVF
uniref:Rho guanine nucleotide exchange factor (GEF) 12b n=1 Tax=Amphilophus citrinellus TaxID=61819 RepID=A0A3Q0S3V7_AMPCI